MRLPLSASFGRRRKRDRLASRLVWILGSPRSGSTWLLGMLRAAPNVIPIDESSIGAHLAISISALNGLAPTQPDPAMMRMNDFRLDTEDYFFSARYRDAWAPPARDLILRRFEAQVADELEDRRGALIVVKEPHGSIGADVLMSLLPESRLLFLLRDGRDVIDSELDAASPGTWATNALPPTYELADADRGFFIRERANAWLARTVAVEKAYERHPAALRMLVRYEDLRRDARPLLRSVCDWLQLELADAVLDDVVNRTSFERIPGTGPGQFVRAASPGDWRTNMTADEQAIMDRVIGTKLRELGYE